MSGKGPTPSGPGGRSVAVVGAGAFGGWAAWHLLRAGCQVTLVDAWGPGNSRASSGGDTRVMRHGYGDDVLYLRLAARSLELFQEHERLWDTPLYDPTGVLWLVHDDDVAARTSQHRFVEAGIPHRVLDRDTLAQQFPQLGLDDIRYGLLEESAGILSARRSCAAVHDAFEAAGGRVVRAWAEPGALQGDQLDALTLSDGARLEADAYVFACGPWLGRVCPDLAPPSAPLVKPTRQEVFTFGVPPGDTQHVPPALPIWADQGERFWYGIPGNLGRGFKLGDDTRGAEIDPTADERVVSQAGLEAARAYLGQRFPALVDAPLIESRVCCYEESPDGDFLVDRHPAARNAWLLGGGSGHGFKHGPALGELLTQCLLGERTPETRFAIERFASA